MNVHRKTSAMFAAFTLPPTLSFKHWLDRLMHLLTETDTTLAECASSWTLIGIGVVLALPSEALVNTIPLFDRMLHVMPEHPWWSGVFIAFGGVQSYANIRRRHAMRRYMAFVAAVFFGFLGILGIVSTAPVLILGAVFLVHSLTQGLVYLQLGVHE